MNEYKIIILPSIYAERYGEISHTISFQLLEKVDGNWRVKALFDDLIISANALGLASNKDDLNFHIRTLVHQRCLQEGWIVSNNNIIFT